MFYHISVSVGIGNFDCVASFQAALGAPNAGSYTTFSLARPVGECLPPDRRRGRRRTPSAGTPRNAPRVRVKPGLS
jgi:hypothetical protein